MIDVNELDAQTLIDQTINPNLNTLIHNMRMIGKALYIAGEQNGELDKAKDVYERLVFEYVLQHLQISGDWLNIKLEQER